MRIGARQYAQILYELTEGKSKPEIEKSVADFARYLYKERKLKLADKIIKQFAVVYNEKNGFVEAKVISRKKIGEALKKKIQRYMKEKYRAREVILKNMTDENIKGGVIIRVEDEVMDGSIANRLKELKEILSN